MEGAKHSGNFSVGTELSNGECNPQKTKYLITKYSCSIFVKLKPLAEVLYSDSDLLPQAKPNSQKSSLLSYVV